MITDDIFKIETPFPQYSPVPEYQPTGTTGLSFENKGGNANIDFFGNTNSLNQYTAPTYFDPVEESLSKFKQSDYFKEKGFLSGRDNEQIYGERQTFGNKFVNGISGMADLAIYQFGDQLKGWGRMADALFSWDSSKLWGEDPEEAAKKFKEVVDKNGIFMTEQDRDSIFNWSKVFNTVQQAGFTIGAIAEIAAEELATAGIASALQGTKVGRFMKALSSWRVDVNKMDRTLNETSKLRQWFKNISHNVESTPFVPFGGESLSFGAKAIGYGKKAGETGLEFAGRGFGAFYRDLRMFNSAATEARAEASGTYTDLKEKLINYELKKGNTLTYDKLQQIEELSKKAGQTNFLANTAIIGISDKIMFDGLFKSMKSVKGLLSEEGLIGSIRKGKGIEFFKRGFNLKTLKEGIRTKPLTYFKNNITEALQENLQDASNNAVQAYYESKYKNPGKQALQIGAYDAISQGLGTQFSKQGFETFLSGFATGAIVSPMLGGTKFLYNRATTTKEQRVEQDKRTNNDITQLQGLFSSAYAPAAGVSLSTAGLMQEAAKKNSIKDFQDAKDIQIREAAALLIRTNQTEKYFDLLEDQAQTLTQKEFEDAYGVDFKADNKNSAQDYINSFKQKVEEMDKLNRDFTYMFGSNPFKPSDEVNYTAWENAKWHTLYIKDAHSRAIQRSTELINSLPSKLQNLDVQSFLPLFDNKLFENEKKLLQEEIKAGVSPELTKDKIARLKILEKIEQQDSLSLNPEESYNEKLYEKYLLQIAKENKIDLTKEQIQEGLNNIRDIKNLRLDERNLLNNINWLVNPQNMSTLRQQHLEATQKMWEELTSKLTREEQKPTEETVEQPKQETTTEETAATFTPTTPYGTPTGETLITSTESIQTETKELPKEFFDEVLEQIFYKGIDFNNNQVNSVDDIERLFDKHSDIIVPLLKKYNVDPEDLFQKILEEEQLDESPILDNFKNNINKIANIKKKLEEILNQVEQTKELTKQQTSYLQNNKQIIDKVDLLKAMFDDIQDTVKPKEDDKENIQQVLDLPIINNSQISEKEKEIKETELQIFILENENKEVIIDGIQGLLFIINENRIEITTENKIFEIQTKDISNFSTVYNNVKKLNKYAVKILSENEVIVNEIKYTINVDNKGNIVSLSPVNNISQTIKNEKLLVAVEIERNKFDFINLQIDKNNEVDTFLEENNYKDLDFLLNTIFNYNFTDTISEAIDKLYNSIKLNNSEKLQLKLWLQDSFDRLVRLIDSKNSKLENETILNAYDNLETILNLLYDKKIDLQENKQNIEQKQNIKKQEDEKQKTNNIAETKIPVVTEIIAATDNEAEKIKERKTELIKKLEEKVDKLNEEIKQIKETKIIQNSKKESIQEDKPIEGLFEQEKQTPVEYSSTIKTRTNEAKDIPDKIDLPFNSVYDMTIGNMIRFINSSQGREYLETLGYKIVIQKITADFFNSHSPNPDFVTSERDPYNYFKKVENQGVTNYAFVLKDKNNQDVYINPNFFHDNSQPFTTQEGLKLAINLPKDSVTDEVELSWDDLVSKNGAIDQFKNGRLTPISEFLKGTDVEEQFSIVKGQKIGKYMVVKPNGVRQNGGLYLDLPNGYSIKLLPGSPASIKIQGDTISLLDIVDRTYEPEQQTEMIDFLNKILIRDTGAVDEMFYRVVRNGNKIEIEAYKYTDRNEKGFGTNPVKQNLTTQQVAARIKNINILNIDFSVDRQITVPLLTKDSVSFKQMSYLEFVQDNTYTSKKRYINALTNKPQIQTIHDGFSVKENVLKAKIETTYQKELEKLFNCLS